ncbi:MAG TPA: excisionase family DNA-binding protein [Planctomycetes bacterium]|nr:excisionase family DNA-binding protein [Planctomycetota bacterium]
MVKKHYITIPQLAKALGISRIAVYRRVKSGAIAATKVGRTYVISDRTVNEILGKALSQKTRDGIDKAIDCTTSEYGQVLKWLSKE